MKTVEFEYYVEFGRGDGSDYMPCEVELTDEEYDKLQQFYKENPGEEALDNEGFEEIQEKFLDAAIQCEWENSFDRSDVVEYTKGNRGEDDDIDFDEDEDEDADEDDYELTFEDLKAYYTEYASIGIVENVPEEDFDEEDEEEE